MCGACVVTLGRYNSSIIYALIQLRFSFLFDCSCSFGDCILRFLRFFADRYSVVLLMYSLQQGNFFA